MKNTLLLLIIICPFLNSCRDCGPQAEPEISIFFSSFGSESLTLNKIHALNAQNQDVFQEQNNQSNIGSHSFFFPISLHADSTTYIFEFENRIDTLTIFYKREFYHKHNCGFVVDALEPVNSVTNKSTFSEVDVSYTPYVGYGKSPSSTHYNGGITVNIRP